MAGVYGLVRMGVAQGGMGGGPFGHIPPGVSGILCAGRVARLVSPEAFTE